MSDDDLEEEVEGADPEPEEQTEPAAPDDADGPDLDDEDMVEVPDDVAEQVADADTDEEADDEESRDDDASPAPSPAADADVSLGDVYCNALGMGATVAKQEYGEGVGDFETTMDQYAMMARQCDLDAYVDQWAAEHGGAEMTPAQGILVGTAMFAMSVAASDSQLASNAMEAAT
ncbi:hypothetical protein [Halostella salina]|uniref:hypothetical protein n=1 Tax=Halostella salina TaxID=1547897 RepID=UPI000EF80ECC|nr:hypothetical protein [Halostella salina]